MQSEPNTPTLDEFIMMVSQNNSGLRLYATAYPALTSAYKKEYVRFYEQEGSQATIDRFKIRSKKTASAKFWQYKTDRKPIPKLNPNPNPKPNPKPKQEVFAFKRLTPEEELKQQCETVSELLDSHPEIQTITIQRGGVIHVLKSQRL